MRELYSTFAIKLRVLRITDRIDAKIAIDCGDLLDAVSSVARGLFVLHCYQMLSALLALTLASAAAPEVSAEVRAATSARKPGQDAAFIAEIERLADRDDASAIELLGEAYLFGGFGLARSPTKACSHFTRAADRRGDSAHNLARCYEHGEGLPADLAAARQWYAKAAALGYAKSHCALGNMMVAGRGGSKDIAGGIAKCRQAAEAGEADAQTDFANYLLMGTGGPKDPIEARKWYTLAAEQGQANAQFVLGQIHWKGDGTPVDQATAVKWWKLAYEGGRKDAAGLIVGAMFKLLIVEHDGKRTVDRSHLPETLLWLERAATEDPNPAQRQRYAEILADLRG
jgi:uncharacterized protein